MSNHIDKSQVFNQIVDLQKNLESIDKILFKIQLVSESQSCVEPEEGAPIPLDYDAEVALEKIKTIREIVMSRENTINTMLDFYLSLYRELDSNEK